MTSPATPTLSRPRRLALLALLMVLTALPFLDTFHAPFIFDDLTIVDRNLYMRSLWPITQAMEAPRLSTAAGRPLVAYSFAVNYAISGLDEWSYHVLNLLIHLGCVYLLYRIIRGLRPSPMLADHPEYTNRAFAWLVALIWGVHPLNSESVIYISQRTELMFAAFTLGAFAVLLRALRVKPGERTGRPTQAVVVLLVTCAALCKETAAVIPPLVLLFDRAFIAGTFKAALRQRGLMYLGLLLPIIVAVMISLDGHRGGLIVDDPDITWRYLITQGAVIIHYIRLSIVPYPLVVTYDWPLATGLVDSLPWSAVVLALFLLSCWAVWRRPKLGFLGMWFFFILAPTSSFIPILTEIAGERRMYLPLLSVMLVIAVGVLAAGRWFLRREAERGWLMPGAAGAGVCLAVVFIVMTAYRGADYTEAIRLWDQTVRHQPDSLMAKTNYAGALLHANRIDEADRYVSEVLTRKPDYPRADFIKGMIQTKRNDWEGASDSFMRAAMSLDGNADDYAYAGMAYAMIGKMDAAEQAFKQALNIEPDNSQALMFLGVIQGREGNHEQAIEIYRHVIALYPENPSAYGNLGYSLSMLGRNDEAREAFNTAVRLFPESAEIAMNAANFEASVENYEEAASLFHKVTEISPQDPVAQFKLALCLARTDNPATDYEFRHLLNMNGQFLDGYRQYAKYLLDKQRLVDADGIVRRGLRVAPEDPVLREFAVILNRDLHGVTEPPPATSEGVPPADAAPAPPAEDFKVEAMPSTSPGHNQTPSPSDAQTPAEGMMLQGQGTQ